MISLKKIVKAQTAIAPYIQTTSLVRVDYLSELTQMNVFLKLENMQYTGSFKLRGAMNKIAQLTPEEKAKGVVAASAGNHAQGVARSAKIFGVKATIVMPTVTPIIKVKATRDYGAEVILYGDNYDEACKKAKEICEERGAVFVHPFNDEAVICGQGTIGLEIMTQLRNIDAVVVPVGGGGLISGVAKAVKSLIRTFRYRRRSRQRSVRQRIDGAAEFYGLLYADHRRRDCGGMSGGHYLRFDTGICRRYCGRRGRRNRKRNTFPFGKTENRCRGKRRHAGCGSFEP